MLVGYKVVHVLLFISVQFKHAHFSVCFGVISDTMCGFCLYTVYLSSLSVLPCMKAAVAMAIVFFLGGGGGVFGEGGRVH